MDLVAFGRALSLLTIADIRAIAADLDVAVSSTADEIGATRAVLAVEVPEHRTLQRLHHLGIGVRRPGPEQEQFAMHGGKR